MTDLLERLRAANPVPACPAPSVEEVWRRVDLAPAGDAAAATSPALRPGLRRRALPARWPLALPPLALAAAAVVVAVVLLAGRGPGPSIVSRAYAAVDGSKGTLRYTETSTATAAAGAAAGHPTSARARLRVWVSGVHSHATVRAVVLSPSTGRVVGVWATFVDGRPLMRGAHAAAILRLLSLARVAAGRPCKAQKHCNVTFVDPLVTLRTLYLAHQLRPAGRQSVDGRVLDAIVDTGRLQRFRLLVDPRTFAPVRAQVRIYGPKNRLEAIASTNFTHYQRLLRPLPRAALAPGVVGLPPRAAARALRAQRAPATNAPRAHR